MGKGWLLEMIIHSLVLLVISIGTFVIIPLYFTSRLLNVTLPIIIVIWLYVNDLWTEIHTFQYCMLAVYGFLLSLIIIIGLFVFRLHNIISYIMPKMKMDHIQNVESANRRLEQIKEFYVECKTVVPREIAICK